VERVNGMAQWFPQASREVNRRIERGAKAGFGYTGHRDGSFPLTPAALTREASALNGPETPFFQKEWWLALSNLERLLIASSSLRQQQPSRPQGG
jgi:hypothetical protein